MPQQKTIHHAVKRIIRKNQPNMILVFGWFVCRCAHPGSRRGGVSR